MFCTIIILFVYYILNFLYNFKPAFLFTHFIYSIAYMSYLSFYTVNFFHTIFFQLSLFKYKNGVPTDFLSVNTPIYFLRSILFFAPIPISAPMDFIIFPPLKALFADREGIIPGQLPLADGTLSGIASALIFQNAADFFFGLPPLFHEIFCLDRQPHFSGKLEVQIQHFIIAFQII